MKSTAGIKVLIMSAHQKQVEILPFRRLLPSCAQRSPITMNALFCAIKMYDCLGPNWSDNGSSVITFHLLTEF